jgi:hypothetical protein
MKIAKLYAGTVGFACLVGVLVVLAPFAATFAELALGTNASQHDLRYLTVGIVVLIAVCLIVLFIVWHNWWNKKVE